MAVLCVFMVQDLLLCGETGFSHGAGSTNDGVHGAGCINDMVQFILTFEENIT